MFLPVNTTSTETKRKETFQSYLTTISKNPDFALLKYSKDHNEYYKIASDKSDEQCNKISQILSGRKKENIQNSFHNVDITKYLPKLNCSNTHVCLKSENVSKDDFQTFLNSFKKKNDQYENQSRNTFVKNTSKSNEESFKPSQEINSKYKTRFVTATEDLQAQNGNINSRLAQKRKIGVSSGLRRPFVSPLQSNNKDQNKPVNTTGVNNGSTETSVEVDERLKNIDPKMVEMIKSEIMDVGPGINWNDIAGLDFAKKSIQEAVVWPMLRPDIFTGLRRPPKGILLFGPPGTGKTLIGKCVASQSKSTFFSISASSLTSKWIGDGEKMVRALFAVARVHQPAVIFVDEVDSLLSQRSDNEHESTRRLKTEFLVQLDGATTNNEDRILLIGATNRPQELDEAARRRFVKRLYIPLPEYKARRQLVAALTTSEKCFLSDTDLDEIAKLSDGYSGADMRNLCSEASMGPIRSITFTQMETIKADEVRPISMEDFQNAFARVRSSVAPSDLQQYIIWDQTYGSGI